MYAAIGTSIKQDVKEVERMFRGLKNGAPKVLTSALNKTIGPAKTAAAKSLATDMRVAQKRIKPFLDIDKATRTNLRAVINVSGKRIPVMAFTPKKTKKGITYKKPGVGRGLLPSAFFATMPSGHQGVFKRLTKSRLKINELQGASLPHVFVKHHIQKAMNNAVDLRWHRNLDHEIKRLIQKL